MTLATTRSWKDKNSGDKVEETEWHRIVFRDRLAEIAGEYLKKGKQVYVEGRLKTRKYTDKDGVEKYTTEVVATDMTMLGSREGMGAATKAAAAAATAARAARRARASRRVQAGREVEHRLRRHGRRHPLLICPQGRTLLRQRWTSSGCTAAARLPQALRM